MNFKPMLQLALAKLSQKSTWAGLAVIASTVTGATLSPENAELISTVGALVAGAVLVKVNA